MEPITVTVTEELIAALPHLTEQGYGVGDSVTLTADGPGPRPRDRDGH